MNNLTDRDRLLADILTDDAMRAASLAHGLDELRRGRRVRRTRVLCGVCALVLSAAWFVTARRHPLVPQIPELAPVVAQPTSILKILTDDELLDQFPGRAVALVGPAEDRRLVFFDVTNPANREVR